jgi:hypothetical protein
VATLRRNGPHIRDQERLMDQQNATMPTIVDPLPQPAGDPLPQRDQHEHEHEHPTPAPTELPTEPKPPHPSPDPKEVTKEPRTPHPREPRPSHPARKGARERSNAKSAK